MRAPRHGDYRRLTLATIATAILAATLKFEHRLSLRATVHEVDDLEINALLRRLSRPHSSGGVVIERAAILAAGADFPAVMDWITDHAGTADATPTAGRNRGLHGSRLHHDDAPASRAPLRFVLPADALQ